MDRNELIELARRTLPADLVEVVATSLDAPQYGPYHGEGPFLDSHLSAVFQSLRDASEGRFHPQVPEYARAAIGEAAKTHAHRAPLHVLLHDVEKVSCMTFVHEDGRKEAVGRADWLRMLDGEEDGPGIRRRDADALARLCRRRGIGQISYYQEVEGETRTHGKVAADRLRRRGDIDDLVVRGIETHEVAFQFGAKGGVNIPLFEKTFGDWDESEVRYALLVNYADQMGSLGASGEPDISDFLWMARSWDAWGKLQALQRHFAAAARVDGQKLERALAGLRRSPTAFQVESYPDVVARIAAEVALPEVTEAQVRAALAPAIDEGLPEDLAAAIVAEMTSAGKLSAETGRALGPLNRLVRPALARL